MNLSLFTSQLSALAQIPRYRQSAEKLLQSQSQQEFEQSWNEVPYLKKNDLRENFPESFGFTRAQLESKVSEEEIEIEHTSGTTEDSVELILPRGWWAQQEARALSLNAHIASSFEPDPAYPGQLMPPRRVNIVSPACNNDVCFTGVPSRQDRTLSKTLFVNLSRHPFLWTEEVKKQMLEETLDFKPIFLDVDPVYGTLFANYCQAHSVRIPSLKFIVSSYEYLSRSHRRFMSEVFGVPVYNLYGSTETGHLLIEDEAGIIRVVQSNACLEFLPLSSDDTFKECVVTTLTNPYMPLLRYRIGDLLCKRENRFRLMGRQKDAALTRNQDPIPVAWIDDAISVCCKILHYQFIQNPDLHSWRLDYLLRNGTGDLSPMEKNLIQENLTTFLGWDTRLEFHTADYIPCEPSGKFRLVVPYSPTKHI